MMRCLGCYQDLKGGESDYHASCARKLFGHPLPPDFPFTEADLAPLAKQVIVSQTALTGVQPKLSLHLDARKPSGTARRFALAGLQGGYIFKPPIARYPELPEVEDLTMHLARSARLKTAPHGLIRMQSGNLAYLTRRMDRTPQGKLAMEDFCQLTERLTEDKYKGSYEQIGRTLLKHSATPLLDAVNLFEVVVFCFITGNVDMHLKNFSLLEQAGLGMVLSPAYDLVNTALVNPADNEELALTLNGKKRRLKRQDFVSAMTAVGLNASQQSKVMGKWHRALPDWHELIDRSFLSPDFKARYKDLIRDRMQRLK